MIEREITGPFGTLLLGIEENTGEKRRITSLAADRTTVVDSYGASTADFSNALNDLEAIFDTTARFAGRIDSIDFFSDADADIHVRSFFRSVIVSGDDVDGIYFYRLDSVAAAMDFAEGLDTLIGFFDETDLIETILPTPVEEDPLAQDDFLFFEGLATEPASGNLLADNGNGPDSDPQDNPISIIAIEGVPFTQDPFGTLSFDFGDGVFGTLTPSGDFFLDTSGLVEFAGTFATSFDYILSDSAGNTDRATVTVEKEIPPSIFDLGDDTFELTLQASFNGTVSGGFDLSMNDRYFGTGFPLYEVVEGDLPPGFSSNGQIISYGLTAGDYAFSGTYRVSDFSGSATAEFDISITVLEFVSPLMAVPDVVTETIMPPDTFAFNVLTNDTLPVSGASFLLFSDLSGNTDAFDVSSAGLVTLSEDDPGLYVLNGSYEVFASDQGEQFTDTADFSITVEVLDDRFDPF